VDTAILDDALGELELHESGTYVRLLKAGGAS
jgi:hypothetical protein